jgi:hypothetical protein
MVTQLIKILIKKLTNLVIGVNLEKIENCGAALAPEEKFFSF